MVPSSEEDAASTDARDYAIDYYVRLLRLSYATRLARAFKPDDFSTVFADPDQASLFDPSVELVRTILTQVAPSSPE